MAGICCGIVGPESETSAPVERTTRVSRRRRMEIRQFKFAAEVMPESVTKRQKIERNPPSPPVENTELDLELPKQCEKENGELGRNKGIDLNLNKAETSLKPEHKEDDGSLKFGMTSVCGRRRDMEDSVSIHPSFSEPNSRLPKGCHFYGVFDGHGCSHVALKCKARMHEIVKEELNEIQKDEELVWKDVMERSFSKMDKEVKDSNNGGVTSNCRCELRMPQCDAVGSTAVVAIVTPEKIILSNCGDSRAVLCRNGVAVSLSSDHKPDRPDELKRIESAGGRVIYWDGPRVLGVLAMSRAIGDNYLKPYVIPDPEVTIMDRTAEDECLILASDGLWDVVSNETACGVARMCLRAQRPPSQPVPGEGDAGVGSGGEGSDKGCLDASILLTKLALARHSTDNVSVVVIDLKRDQ